MKFDFLLLCANSHTSLRVFDVLAIMLRVKAIQKRVIKEGIMSPKISINGENPSLCDGNKNFEAVVRIMPKWTLEEHLREILKDYESLEDVPWETRKEEASKPMYLVRYE
jgi:hypothetical protein